MPPQVSILGNSQFEPPGIDECVKGAVDDPLWPDVHPATGSHLAIVGNSHLFCDLPVIGVVEHPHHQGVGDDHPWGFFF
jgi:hypothetical protein